MFLGFLTTIIAVEASMLNVRHLTLVADQSFNEVGKFRGVILVGLISLIDLISLRG